MAQSEQTGTSSEHVNAPPLPRFDAPFATRRRQRIATAAGLALVLADLVVFFLHMQLGVALPLGVDPNTLRGWAFFGCALLFVHLSGDWDAVGLNLRPRQSWWWWARATIGAGLVVLSAVIVFAAGYYLVTGDVPFTRPLPPERWAARLLAGCIVYPLTEEGIYRFALCHAVRPAGRVTTVLASGILFALLHFIYGNAAPTNVVAGFVLGWAFLKSETLVVPILLHSLGNFMVIAWYASLHLVGQ
jgi:membrane protease YdiL (CAAX protease family)